MQIPSFRRLVNSDFPNEFKKLVDQLALLLNNSIEVVYQALNRNITLRDNIKSSVRDVIVTVDSNGKPIQTTAFTLDFDTKIDATIVGVAQNQTNTSIYPTSQPFISGIQSAKVFTINNITGLQASNKYFLRITVFHQ